MTSSGTSNASAKSVEQRLDSKMGRILSSLGRKFLDSKRAKQVVTLYSAEIGLLVLTFLTGMLNSRFLGPTEYGYYTFIITIVEVVSLFGGLGVAPSGARLIAFSEKGKNEQAMMGALVVIGLLLGVFMSVLMVVSSPFIDAAFHTNLQGSILLGSIICSTAPLQLILYRACLGANRTDIIAVLIVLPKALFLIGAGCMIVWAKWNAKVALGVYFVGTVGGCLYAIYTLRIRFEEIPRRIHMVVGEVRSYGFNVYLGGLADNSTFKLNRLLIAGFVHTTWLGFYSIATTLVSPMVRFSTSISATFYRSFTTRDRIDKKVFLVNAFFLTASALLIAIFVRPLISLALTDEFLPAAGLVYILLFTSFFQGMYQPMNQFLAAHGKGKESRRISFFVSIVNLAVAVVLIPPLGAYGAAIGSSIAKFCECMGNVYYYRKTIHSLQKNAEVICSS